ncbi:methionine synthase [Actinomycetospora sp. NBRC 106375]|uniref:cobalamin-independent methionine synthase II family protein n=1 Tax=Actinomycetospora sp. NBRC 106375 TaxID=3032207 RepID=UPI0024A15977|nr:cobalamin-independent methionine synthase II family protein [Actinomycetospora sp. NBRC 106375]GLZ46986.1 methionine synthase [Actinomycetospora sp. NBRC 106375]
MQRSTDRIRTTQAGSLPRPEALLGARVSADVAAAVADVVAAQREAGIDQVGDGEYGKEMTQRVNYGAWWSYSFSRLGGLELDDTPPQPVPSASTGLTLGTFAQRRDRERFAEVYADPDSGATPNPRGIRLPVCRGPLTYVGQEQIAADVARFRAALDAAGLDEGFMTSIGPGSCSRIGNEYYPDDESFLYACADAMREEYAAILDAGLVLQVDDPAIAENFDQVVPEPSVEDYRRYTRVRIEALNHALRGLPRERIRFHLCWGSWHGPHTTDLPLADLADLVAGVHAGAVSFEAGNVRHEHEWKVWRDVDLPEDTLLLPGVVSHATNLVEHPELVADRVERFAGIVGRERVVASTDCGLGGRVHPQLAWAKLRSLAEGAAIASRRLWRT